MFCRTRKLTGKSVKAIPGDQKRQNVSIQPHSALTLLLWNLREPPYVL